MEEGGQLTCRWPRSHQVHQGHEVCQVHQGHREHQVCWTSESPVFHSGAVTKRRQKTRGGGGPGTRSWDATGGARQRSTPCGGV
ncbi:hypothetical protein GN956_G5960 [Arapaima gigas]